MVISQFKDAASFNRLLPAASSYHALMRNLGEAAKPFHVLQTCARFICNFSATNWVFCAEEMHK